jgi:hypothetical protein
MKRILAMILGLGLLGPACADPVAPPAPTPVEPTITESFSDTLVQLGSNTHLFTVQQIGGLKVSISDVTPDAAVTFAVGTQSPLLGCSPITQQRRAPGAAAQLSGTATTTGQFCVMVFDFGAVLTEPVTYTVTILHS